MIKTINDTITELPKTKVGVKVGTLVGSFFGKLDDCIISAFAGTFINEHLLAAGLSQFNARFISLSISFFILEITNGASFNIGKLIIRGVKKLFGVKNEV